MVAGHGVGAPMVDRLYPGGEQLVQLDQVTRAADAADLDRDQISFTRGPAHPLRRRRRLAHVLAESTGKITGPGVHRSYLRAVKRAHHNSYRVKDPATTAPTTSGRPRSTSADYHFEQQLKLRGIGLTVPLANPNRWPTIAGEWPSINAKVRSCGGSERARRSGVAESSSRMPNPSAQAKLCCGRRATST
jgi:hypothetical protein